MSDLQDYGPRDRALVKLSLLFALELPDKAGPDNKEEFDYPSFMARELIRGLRPYGELDLF